MILKHLFSLLFLCSFVKLVKLDEDCNDIVLAKEDYFNDEKCLEMQGNKLKSKDWPCYKHCVYSNKNVFESDNSLNITKNNVPKEIGKFLISKVAVCREEYYYGYNVNKTSFEDDCKSSNKFSKCFTNIWDFLIEFCKVKGGSSSTKSNQTSTSYLNANQSSEITRIWDIVATDLRGLSLKFFNHFFGLYPQYATYFAFVKKIDPRHLLRNKQLQGHAFVVFEYINALVSNFQDISLFDALLYRIGVNHGKRNLTINDFGNLKLALVSFLNVTLGPEIWTPSALSAWAEFYGVWTKSIDMGIKEVLITTNVN